MIEKVLEFMNNLVKADISSDAESLKKFREFAETFTVSELANLLSLLTFFSDESTWYLNFMRFLFILEFSKRKNIIYDYELKYEEKDNMWQITLLPIFDIPRDQIQ